MPVPKALCKVCCAAEAKYKCPTCRIPFCSVHCSRTHREKPCITPEPAPVAADVRPVPITRHDDSTALSDSQISQLCSNDKIQVAVRDPVLQAVLKRIDSADNPIAALEREFTDPHFVFFADTVLEAVDAREIDLEERRRRDMERAKEELLRLVAGQKPGN